MHRLVLALVLAATGTVVGVTPAVAAQQSIAIDFAGTTPTPAPGVPGAQNGGQVT